MVVKLVGVMVGVVCFLVGGFLVLVCLDTLARGETAQYLFAMLVVGMAVVFAGLWIAWRLTRRPPKRFSEIDDSW